MKTRTSLLFLCTILSCTNVKFANSETRNRETEAFRQIKVSAGIDVYFTQEKSHSLRIVTENVDANDVISEVKNETLDLCVKDRRGSTGSIKVYVSAPVLEALNTSGGSDFYADNLKSAKFDIASSGGSDIHIGNLSVDDKINIASSGGSDVDIKNLQTTACQINASGGSDVTIKMDVSGELTVAASGSSDIKLSGKANNVSLSASGASDIDARNLKYKQINSSASGGAEILSLN